MLAICEITRVVVDTSSSVNLIYRDKLDNRATQNPIGTVILPTYVGGFTMDAKFTIIDSPYIYITTSVTPWIHTMQAVSST